MGTFVRGIDFCIRLLHKIRPDIHKEGWSFFVFYVRSEHNTYKRAKFECRNVDYAEFDISGRATIGILIDKTKSHRFFNRTVRRLKRLRNYHLFGEMC